MLKLLLTLAPIYMRAKQKDPARFVAGSIGVFLLLFMSAVFLSFAAFIWLEATFGPAEAFLGLSLAYALIAAFIMLMNLKAKRIDAEHLTNAQTPLSETDAVAAMLPQSIREDERYRKLIEKVADNPIATTSAAVTLGYMISHEYLNER